MKKLLFIFVISLSIFHLLPAATSFTLPAWFKKHKIINTTDYQIMIRASFSGYDSPSPFFKTISGADTVGTSIEPKSNSNDPKTKFFEIGNYGNSDDNSFTAIGTFRPNQNFLTLPIT